MRSEIDKKKPQGEKTYKMSSDCANCRQVVTTEIPKGTAADGFVFICENCGCRLIVKD